MSLAEDTRSLVLSALGTKIPDEIAMIAMR